MTASILIIAASGNVGSQVVSILREREVACRIAARNPQRAREQFGEQAEIVLFDFLKPETYPDAFAGVEQLFLVRPPQLANVQRDIAPAIHAALAAGVGQIVFLSLQGVENNRVTPHYKIEQLLHEADVHHTFLRAGFFMQNLSTTHRDEIRDDDEIVVPVGSARTSFIDVRDIAAVAVEALLGDAHRNQAYTLTGSEALTYHEVAAIMSEVLKRRIRYTNPSALAFFWRQVRAGEALGYAFVVTALYTLTRFGNAAQVTDDVRRILGRDPLTMRQFIENHQALWRP